ncbi:type II toxin-antitoxin system VapC family toxin [Azospirillum largimobile]
MATFFDTNALIYLLDRQSPYHKSSMNEFIECKAKGPVVVCDIVYCEFSIGMGSKEAVDAAIAAYAFERFRGSDEALIKAGAAFKKYKDFVKEEKRKQRLPPEGEEGRRKVLPDFYVGAIAEAEGCPLVTRDKTHYEKWFVDLELIILCKSG